MYPGTYAKTTPDKPAVIMASSGRVVTYRELNDESMRLACAFREAGFTVGDRVVILLDNDPRFLTVCWAARRIGLYYVPLNWHLTTKEMAYVINNCQAKGLITNASFPEIAVELRRDCPSVQLAIAMDEQVHGFADFDQLVGRFADADLEDEVEGDDLIYTSGTTGLPKGGLKPLRLRHPSETKIRSLLVAREFGFGQSTVYLTPGAPLYHAAPLRFSVSVTQLGGTNILMEKFDPVMALAAIDEHRVTHSQWVPTMFVRLLQLPEVIRSRFHLSTHQMAIHAAAPCPIDVKARMIDWWGPIITEYYGASEGGGITSITSPEWLQHRGSVGRGVLGTFHVLSEEGEELPVGEVGVIYSEGSPQIDYLGDPEKTKRAYSQQGWVTVGDMGYLDEEGYLYLTDRKDHMIISGGVNIYPQESESVLAGHPKVADVAVIGVPHAEFGEEVKAVIQLTDPGDAGESLAEELLSYCRDRLARYKCPRSVDFVPDLPRAPSGKLYKRRLRNQYWEGHNSLVI
jgi:long-chain acyl-CoA synthetase